MSKYKPIIESYIHCVEDDDFMTQFYDCFLNSNPRIKQMFNYTDLSKQKELVRKGLMSMITYLDSENIGGKVTLRRLKETHGKGEMDIQHHHYQLWKSCLIATIRSTDTSMTEEGISLWEEVLDKGIALIASENHHFHMASAH